MAQKLTTKCDKCGKEVTKGGYYELVHHNVPGWAVFYTPHPHGRHGVAHLCEPCFDGLNLEAKEN